MAEKQRQGWVRGWRLTKVEGWASGWHTTLSHYIDEHGLSLCHVWVLGKHVGNAPLVMYPQPQGERCSRCAIRWTEEHVYAALREKSVDDCEPKEKTMRMLDFQNVKADVLLVSHHLDKARTLLIHGNPAIPGLLEGEAVHHRDEAAGAIAQAMRFNGNLLAMLREREKAYQKKVDAIDV